MSDKSPASGSAPRKRKPLRVGVCLHCSRVKALEPRNLCHSCYRHYRQLYPRLRDSTTKLPDLSSWSDEWCAHLDAMGELVLRRKPVTGLCADRDDRSE